MTKTLLLVAAALFFSVASAAPVRTVDGDRVESDHYVTVSWSMNDAASLKTLRTVSGLPGVLAVNTDGAGSASQVGPFLRSRGIDLPVVVDVRGEISPELDADATQDEVLVALESRGLLPAGVQVVQR